MTRGEFYSLGSKLIGIYCIAVTIKGLFEAFPLKFTYIPQLRQSPPLFTFSHWLSLVGPIGFLALGIYLIRDGSHLRNFAFHDDIENAIGDSRDFFDVGVKLYGLYLLAGTLPDCIWLLANVLIVLRAPPYLSVEDELENIRSYSLPVLTTIILGTCALVWSGLLTRLVFRHHRSGMS